MPAVLGVFILFNGKRILKSFNRQMNGFYNNSTNYGNADSLDIEKNYWDVLYKTNLVGEGLCQSKDDNVSGGVFYGLF